MTSVSSFDESLEPVPTPTANVAPDGSQGLVWIYSLTIFLSAFLLFQLQPLIAKFILPWFGGMPSVWTTCMLFFQMLLFGGYAYAHLTTSRLRPRTQAVLHIVLLVVACVVLPIIPADSLKPTGNEEPISRIVWVLAATVGAPFFILSATGPLLQGWFSRTHPSRSPYRLYALSNIGSLLALVTFPTLFEWLLPARLLAWAWSISFALFGVLCGICAWASAARGQTVSSEVTDSAPTEAVASPGWGTWLLWFALAMIPSVLLLATTNQVCLDVASVPFLWVLPLTLYLLSFILCFDSDRWYSRRWFIPAALVAMGCVCVVLEQGAGAHFALQLGVYFSTLFFCAMVCHGELVRRKPHVRDLTSFYLVISAGGAAGGIFVGIIAPLVFTGYYELHFGLFACALLILVVLGLERRQLPFPGPWWLVWTVLLLCVGSLGSGLAVVGRQRTNVITVSRNFYGVLRVITDDVSYGDESADNEPVRELLNGRIQHGFQFLNPDLEKVPTSYYGFRSGVGRALSLSTDGPRRVGLVGLGTGTLATYARPKDHFQFYEINSKVEDLAKTYFTFLADCKGEVEIIHGDARLNLNRESPQRFDVLVLDAFSGDAIPVHLLTREAFAIYLPHMAPNGIIAIHISNKHFALEPVVLALADVYHLATVTIHTGGSNTGEGASSWVLVSPSERVLHAKGIWSGRSKTQSDARVLWTDDHASLFEVWLAGVDGWFDFGRRRAKLHPGGVEMPDKPDAEEEPEAQEPDKP
ncbi:MAG TPA: fused MFS/spermidine synthase [Planctomycetaceae bacterium]|nr:fused MFS/spermidine synthase [Planctomycetaceae bacterium]